jgi:HEAT repeat protein/signal transduction histidine kinase
MPDKEKNSTPLSKSESLLEPFIKDLQNKKWQVRCSAVSSIETIKSVKAVDLLIQALKDKNWHVRCEVVRSLKGKESEKIFKALINTLGDKAWKVRCEAVKVLGNIKSEKTIEPLICTSFSDKSWQVRCETIKALINIKSEKAVEHFDQTLVDKDRRVRLEVVKTLSKIKSKKSIELLIKALYDISLPIRIEALNGLRRMKSEESIKPLYQLLNDKNWNVRFETVKALGEIESEKIISPLNQALRDKRHEVRYEALKGLCKIKSEEVIEPICQVLTESEDNDIRELAIYTLCQIESEKVVEPLCNIVNTVSGSLLKEVIITLCAFKSLKAIKPLSNILSDASYWNRFLVIKFFCELKTEEVMDPIIFALNNDEKGIIRNEAIEALGYMQAFKALDSIINALNDVDSYVRETAAIALGRMKHCGSVDSLIKALKDKDCYVRSAAVWALGEIRPKVAVKELQIALNDNAYCVREKAAEALGKIKPEEGVKSFTDKFENVEEELNMYSYNKTKRILIVDDEADTRELICDFLEGENEDYIVSCAGDAFEGIEVFERFKPDLVITDIRMPGMTGLDYLEWIKNKDSSTTVIMVSAVKDIESAISAMSKGAYDYIAKPFKLTEVGLIVRKALERDLEKSNILNELNKYKKLTQSLFIERENMQHKIDQLAQKKKVDIIDTYRSVCGSVSHSLKGEFLHIGDAVEEIRSLCSASQEMNDVCELIERSLAFSQITLRRLLNFIEIGNYQFKEVPLLPLLKKTEEIVKPRLKSNIQLSLRENKAMEEAVVWCDEEQLIGVILELIKNATKALHLNKGKIELSVHEQNDYFIISVKDNGPGIPRTLRDKILIDRISESTGSGIGLFLSAKVIRALGGEIILKSTSETGTEFHVKFSKKNSKGG